MKLSIDMRRVELALLTACSLSLSLPTVGAFQGARFSASLRRSNGLSATPEPEAEGFWKEGVYYKIEGKREVPAVEPNPSKVDFPRRQYFYGQARVSLGEGYKPMTEVFVPSWKDDQCSLCVVEVPLPLGMVLEESESLPGRIQVAEVIEDTNSEAAGIKAGDVVRLVTAQQKDAMSAAEGNIAFNALAGATMAGVKVKKAIYLTDNKPFEAVFGALGTNSAEKGGTGKVVMVLERRYDESPTEEAKPEEAAPVA